MGNEDLLETSTSVNNAGLIILWPFLVRFFDELQMTENDTFKSAADKNRAVYLLQYLAYNSVVFPEYDLVLNKVLVGIPIEERLNPIEELHEHEIEVSKSLMHGMIANWDKVKNSSPEGVQVTYLQRKGILSQDQNHWKLRVEEKALDVLIQSIPWNISMIKLPWMEKPIYVEWI